MEEKIATWVRPAIGVNDIEKVLKHHLAMNKFQMVQFGTLNLTTDGEE